MRFATLHAMANLNRFKLSINPILNSSTQAASGIHNYLQSVLGNAGWCSSRWSRDFKEHCSLSAERCMAGPCPVLPFDVLRCRHSNSYSLNRHSRAGGNDGFVSTCRSDSASHFQFGAATRPIAKSVIYLHRTCISTTNFNFLRRLVITSKSANMGSPALGRQRCHICREDENVIRGKFFYYRQHWCCRSAIPSTMFNVIELAGNIAW